MTPRLPRASLLFLLAATLLFALPGCGGDDTVDDPGHDVADVLGSDTTEPDSSEPDTAEADTAEADSVDDVDDALDTTPPPPAELPSHAELADGWNVLWPEGETICSRGTPFGFAVYKGRTDRVVVDFIGGGACWNAVTCSLNDDLQIFSDTVDNVLNAAENGQIAGIYQHDNPDNPFADWTHVVIPYCTGDVHWGDAVTTYPPLGSEPAITINHKGGVNARAVLDWVYEHLTAPDKIMVTGCSAGSYGSIMWSPHIMQQYPEARVYQFGDAGAGVITDDFFRNSFPAWNAQASFPDWLPDLDPAQVDLLALELADLYEGIGAGYPEQVLSQFNTRLDENQAFYYEAMGGQGGAEGWSAKMLASIDRIEQSTPNFHAFIPEGTRHCVIPLDDFYTEEVNGVLLTDWLSAMVNDEPLDSHLCDGCVPPAP